MCIHRKANRTSLISFPFNELIFVVSCILYSCILDVFIEASYSVSQLSFWASIVMQMYAICMHAYWSLLNTSIQKYFQQNIGFLEEVVLISVYTFEIIFQSRDSELKKLIPGSIPGFSGLKIVQNQAVKFVYVFQVTNSELYA